MMGVRLRLAGQRSPGVRSLCADTLCLGWASEIIVTCPLTESSEAGRATLTPHFSPTASLPLTHSLETSPSLTSLVRGFLV